MADELDPVIKTIIAEAVGEGDLGMQMVAETILNRAQQRGLSPEGVVTQPSQYTGYWSPGSAAVRAMNDPNVVTAAQAAWQMAQGAGDPTNGANHYFNPNIVRPDWAQGMTLTAQNGGHAFYTDRPFTQKATQSQAPSPVTQSNAIQRQRDLIPSTAGGGSPALQTAMALLASNSTNPYPQTQSPDLRLMRNPMMSQSAAQQQVTPYPANQSLDMLLRRNPNTGTTIATIPTTGIGQPPRQQTVQGIPFNQNGNAYNEAARRAALLANQSYVGQEAGGGTGYQTALERAKRLAALSANQTYVGQQEAGGNIRDARLQPGSPYQNYSIAANGPPGLTRQQYEALNSTGQLPFSNAPTPVTASTRLQQLRNGGGGIAPIPVMASAGLQQTRMGTPLMGGAAPQGAQPTGGGLRVVVNGASSYNGTPQPVQTPVAFTPVQTLQQQGLTNAQAYDLLNSLNRGSLGVGDRITGAGTQASSGASANSIYG